VVAAHQAENTLGTNVFYLYRLLHKKASIGLMFTMTTLAIFSLSSQAQINPSDHVPLRPPGAFIPASPAMPNAGQTVPLSKTIHSTVPEPLVTQPPVSGAAKPGFSTLILSRLGLVNPDVPVLCELTRQIPLNDNQEHVLKQTHKTFVQDHRAAFDSLRIKRNLVKHLEQKQRNAREEQQLIQLNAEISKEEAALQLKRVAQFEHLLDPTQMATWEKLKPACQNLH